MPDFIINNFNLFLIIMAASAVFVFVALLFVKAGYGIFRSKNWGPSIPNKLGWVLMESPVFILMTVLFLLSERTHVIGCLVIFLLFQLHYFQRSFIFPFLIKGSKKKMPLSIIFMGVIFNLFNALMQAGWLFYLSPAEQYTASYLATPQFILGTLVFFAGMVINIHSDHVIRSLRKPGDPNYYMPKGGMYKYVSSANYFGEFTEWLGFAILTFSLPGLIFALWTFANLAPRSFKINKKYKEMFPEDYAQLKPKCIIPFVL